MTSSPQPVARTRPQRRLTLLQAEGIFPAEYDAPTIRGRFGLPDPRAPERP